MFLYQHCQQCNKSITLTTLWIVLLDFLDIDLVCPSGMLMDRYCNFLWQIILVMISSLVCSMCRLNVCVAVEKQTIKYG